ncbi:MAG TPA: hypothetical protein VFY06_14005, partial [Verrucomicrobiae bacterium]|nr:hypothetical protein [Verrucomicrobiae bacterium]
HAVWVDAAGQKNDWLIDCGDEDAVNFTLTDFLHAHGVNEIPRLVLTEGAVRNCGGAQLLDELFGVGKLWTSPVHFRSSAYNESVAEFEQPPSRHKILNRGVSIGHWQVLWPSSTNNFSRADDNALVLLGNFSGKKILLLSDLDRNGQSELLAQKDNLRADIVVAGLPSAGEPLCDALLDATQSKVIIIADSEFPANRRANPTLHERLAQRNMPIIYTRSADAVKILVGENRWKLQTMDGQVFSSP